MVFHLLNCARELHEQHEGAVAWLEASSRSFLGYPSRSGLPDHSRRRPFPMAVEEMKNDMRNNKVDLANMTIPDLGIYASPNSALKLSSLHNAKGREYRAVAIMDLTEGRLPHYSRRPPLRSKKPSGFSTWASHAQRNICSTSPIIPI
ncbi:MAG: hypothetical protein WDN76_04650 [Alphaproteobacteria bacterium]